MLRRFLVFLIFFNTFFLSGVYSQIRLVGQVLDEELYPVNGAVITCQGKTALTDKDGFYELFPLKEGNTGIQVEADNYYKDRVSVILKDKNSRYDSLIRKLKDSSSLENRIVTKYEMIEKDDFSLEKKEVRSKNEYHPLSVGGYSGYLFLPDTKTINKDGEYYFGFHYGKLKPKSDEVSSVDYMIYAFNTAFMENLDIGVTFIDGEIADRQKLTPEVQWGPDFSFNLKYRLPWGNDKHRFALSGRFGKNYRVYDLIMESAWEDFEYIVMLENDNRFDDGNNFYINGGLRYRIKYLEKLENPDRHYILAEISKNPQAKYVISSGYRFAGFDDYSFDIIYSYNQFTKDRHFIFGSNLKF